MIDKLIAAQKHQTRKIAIQADPFTTDERTFPASFSSETPVRREFGLEVLRHDPKGIDLSRVDGGKMPLLAFHDQKNWPIGTVEHFTLDAQTKKTRGQVRFADTERAEEPLKLWRQGVPLNLSIGYDLDLETAVHDPVTDTYSFRWTPAEVSVLPLGADTTIGIGRAKSNEEKLMTDETKLEASGTPETAPVVDLSKMKREHQIAKKAGAQEAIHAERQRIATVHELFDLDIVPRNDFYQGLRARAVDEGWSVDGTRKILLEVISGEAEPAIDYAQMIDTPAVAVRAVTHEGRLPPVVIPPKPGNQARGLGGRIQMGDDARDKFKANMQQALLVRAGVLDKREDIAKAREGGMIGKSMTRMASDFLTIVGESVLHMEDEVIVTRAMTFRDSSGMGQTTSDFTNILANVANKSLLQGWDEAPETWQLWARRGQLPDFKQAEISGLSGFTGLDEVPEDGDITYGKFIDRKEVIKLVQYAKKYRLSRKAIINDDLRAFTAIPRAMGRAGARKVGDVAYSLLDGVGPTLNQDSTALFDTSSHKNYVAANTGPTVATLNTGTVAMAKQTDPNTGRVLNITPAILLVPVSLSATGRVLMAATYDPAGTAGTLPPNPFSGRYTVVTDARLDGQTYGTLAWYLLADPNIFDTVEVAFLNGVAEPYMRENIPWDGQGIEYVVGIDFGVSALDYRGMHKYRGN